MIFFRNQFKQNSPSFNLAISLEYDRIYALILKKDNNQSADPLAKYQVLSPCQIMFDTTEQKNFYTLFKDHKKTIDLLINHFTDLKSQLSQNLAINNKQLEQKIDKVSVNLSDTPFLLQKTYFKKQSLNQNLINKYLDQVADELELGSLNYDYLSLKKANDDTAYPYQFIFTKTSLIEQISSALDLCQFKLYHLSGNFISKLNALSFLYSLKEQANFALVTIDQNCLKLQVKSLQCGYQIFESFIWDKQQYNSNQIKEFVQKSLAKFDIDLDFLCLEQIDPAIAKPDMAKELAENINSTNNSPIWQKCQIRQLEPLLNKLSLQANFFSVFAAAINLEIDPIKNK